MVGSSSAQDKKEPKIALDGKWELVKLTDGGAVWKAEGKHYLVISGDKVSFHKDGGLAEKSDTPPIFRQTTIKIDATKKPFAVDITNKDNLTIPGIFKLTNEGVLTMCFYDTKRPTEFTSTKGNGNILVVLRRVKK
jgi:uncharacterized protein (TIGR03067 family)